MKILKADDLSPGQLHTIFQEAIAPRPLAIVSSTGAAGVTQLYATEWYSSACSYPPMQYFAVDPDAAEGRGGELLEHLRTNRELVLNGVDEALAPALAVIEGPRDAAASDLKRAGLTALPSVAVGAPRIKESPTHLECRVLDIFPTGNRFVVLATVLAFHVRDDLYMEGGKIAQEAYRAVGKIGPTDYCRSSQLYLMTPGLPITEDGVPAGEAATA